MALRISFKPGMKQSHLAARYFQDAVGDLVEAMIDGLDERTFLINAEEGPSLQLRTWSATDLKEQDLHELFDWLLALRADVHGLQEDPRDHSLLGPIVANWMQEHLGGAHLFVELSIVPPEGEVEEQAEFTFGMVRGRTVMISTDTLLFTWLEEGYFGLSMAGYGSYLLELEDGEDSAPRSLRRAS